MEIYKITNIITGKVYIGFSVNSENRFKRHLILAEKGINRRLYDSIRKHGKDNFVLSVITTCTTRSEACELEKLWIKNLNSLMPNGYNMTTGGDGGNTLESWTEEDKLELWKKQGESRRGRIHSEETRLKISKAHKGKVVPQHMREHMSKIMKERGHEPPEATRWQKGQIGTMLGKTHNEDVRRKISEARIGKTWDMLWDRKYVLDRKEKLKMDFTGENNPKYVDFNKSEKLKVLIHILNNIDFNMKDSKDIFGFSDFKVRELFREVGINNFQSFKKENKNDWSKKIEKLIVDFLTEDLDVTEILGVIKWEAPEEFIPANAKGNFPSFIPKTDQQRVQNLSREFNEWLTDGSVWQKTEKIDGSSMTVFVNADNSGVCSRNLELLEDENNTYWKMTKKYKLIETLRSTGRNLAFQGEIYGQGINGNLYGLDDQRFALYAIYDIDAQCYLPPDQAYRTALVLGVPHVPHLGNMCLGEFYGTMQELIDDADGMSCVNTKAIREGYVYKNLQTGESFKVIGSSYLIKKG